MPGTRRADPPDARQVVQRHQIPDHEHLWVPRQRAIGPHLHSPGVVHFGPRSLGDGPAERRSLDARGPDLGGRFDPPQRRVGGVGVDAPLIDTGDEMDLDAHALEFSDRAAPQ